MIFSYLKTSLLGVGLTASLACYWYVNNLQNELELRTKENIESKFVVKGLQASMDGVLGNLEKSKLLIARVEEEREKSKERLDKVEEILQGHNLAKIRSRKPELLRRVYERGINKYYGDMENVMQK